MSPGGGEPYCPAVLHSSHGRCEDVRICDRIESSYAFNTHGGKQLLQIVPVTRSRKGGLAFRTGATLTATCIAPKAPREHEMSTYLLHPETGTIVKRELTTERLVFVRSGECATEWFVPPIPNLPYGPVPNADGEDNDADSEMSA